MSREPETAILAGGCFWGMQDPIRKQDGVISTTVAVGTTVVWANAETNGVPHNVTSGTVQGTTPQADGKFASVPLFNPGEKFEHTFSAPGTYPYYCTVHLAQMQGTITVG